MIAARPRLAANEAITADDQVVALEIGITPKRADRLHDPRQPVALLDPELGGSLEPRRTARVRGDHRMAMALAVAALAARGPVVIDGIEAAELSFPGFEELLLALGARIEVSA